MDWNTHFTHMLGEATEMMYGGHLLGATEAMQRALIGPVPVIPLAATISPQVLDAVLPLRRTAAPQAKAAHTVVGADSGAATVTALRTSEPPDSFERISFMHDGVQHHYLLYVPPGAVAGTAMPLVLMLHGCSQDAQEFATATGMNQAAAPVNALVLYPMQARNANPGGCWNWFEPSNQHRDQGELGLMVAMLRDVMARHPVDKRRVYAAGISAGGAMAALLAREYPDVFAAIGVHSGLQAGAADNMMGALSAMNNGAKLGPTAHPPAHACTGQYPALIVFHGDADTTVHAKNGQQLVDAALHAALCHKGNAVQETQHGQSSAGQRFTRHLYRAADAADPHEVLVEHWVLHNAGHAWSGGSAKVSQTDAKGVNATQEMLRFFLDHPCTP